MKRFMVQCGNFFFRHRNRMFPFVFAAVALSSRPRFFLNNPSLDIVITLIGAALTLSGQAFRLAVIGYAYIKRGGKDGKVFAENLVIRGFYAHCRNPMYTGNILIGTGLSIMYGSLPAYALAIPFFIFVYLSITEAEENYLSRQFGKDYDDYTQHVNRFIPNFSGLKDSLKEFRYDWKRAIRKDYGTVFGTLSGIIFITGWKIYLAGKPPGRVFAGILTAFLTTFCLYLAARILKKTGHLNSANN